MSTCPFCDLSNQKRLILQETGLSYVFLSNPRLMPGHTLITPKRHVERLGQLQIQEQLDIARLTVIWQEKLLKAGAVGCDIRQNYRPFIPDNGLKVGHLHIHLQPRDLNDELFRESQEKELGLFQPLSDEEAESWAKKLA